MGRDPVVLYRVSSDQGDHWVGVHDVFAWSGHDFYITVEYYRLPQPSLPSVSRDRRLYVAIDDAFLDDAVDWACMANMLCYNGMLRRKCLVENIDKM